MDGTEGLTIDRVLAGYIAAKDEAEIVAKRHADELAPIQKRLDLCKAWMQKYLTDQGLDNAKTAHGQCYLSTVMSATVDPEDGWEKLLRFVLEAGLSRVLDALEQGVPEEQGMDMFLQEPALALLNRSVNKTAVKELMEQDKLVPGVKIAHVTNVNVRRS